MSIKVQYVTGTIAAASATLTLTSPGDFTAVSALSKAFLLPATSLQHCGIGSVGNSENRWSWASADLTAVGSITFTRGDTTGACPVACWIVEFTGAAGDSDEFVMRGKTTTAFATTTSATADSVAVSGIVNVNKVVPILHMRFSNNSTSNAGHISAGVQMVVDGAGDDINRLTRVFATSGTPTGIVYNVEWIHADTSVQRGQLTSFAGNTDINTTINTVTNANQAFVYGHLISGHDPDDMTWYAWLTSATNMRFRNRVASAANRTFNWWVVRNPNFVTQHISVVDGTDDWLDVADPQTENVTITSVDLTRSLVIGPAVPAAAAALLDFPLTLPMVRGTQNYRRRRHKMFFW